MAENKKDDRTPAQKAADATKALRERAAGAKAPPLGETPTVHKTSSAAIKKKRAEGSGHSKVARGVSEDMVTSWVDLNLDKERNTKLHNAAKQRNMKLPDMLRTMLQEALQVEWASVEADAALWEPASGRSTEKDWDSMSAEEIQKELARLEAKAAALGAQAEAARKIAEAKVAS